MAVQIVSFHCILKNKLGHVISSTFNHNVLTSSPDGQETLRGLADALQDLRKGEKRQVFLRAEEAYGYYQPNLVLVKRLDEIDVTEPIKLGESVVYVRNGKREVYRVTDVSLDSVTLDANHPLAGQDLVFEIEATDARDATPDEIGIVRSPAENVWLN